MLARGAVLLPIFFAVVLRLAPASPPATATAPPAVTASPAANVATSAPPSPLTPASVGTPIDVTTAVAQKLDASLRALTGRKEGLTPPLAVAIAEHGKLVYDRAFGDAQHGSAFRIASITKMFTAVSVMQLVEQRRIGLDAKVSTYLPDVPHAKEITVRQLLQHESGLWNYGDEAFNTGAVVRPTTPQKILALAATHSLVAPPGTQYTYSNTGYVVLGLLVEKIAGVPLGVYERTHIFTVADMRDTTFDGPGVPVIPGYNTGSGKNAPAFDASWTYAVGNIVSTAADMAKFDIALLGGRLVLPASLAAMQANPIVVPDSPGLSQGLGISIATVQGLRFVGHHGGLPGFAAENEMEPDHDLSFVVLSDASDFVTAGANLQIIRTLYPALGGKAASFATTAGAEDIFITARFRTSLSGFVNGSLDRSQYTPEMNEAMTDDLLAQTSQQLKTLGPITNVVYVGTQKIGDQTVYRYSVTFGGETSLPWLFSIAQDGKISGIRLAQ